MAVQQGIQQWATVSLNWLEVLFERILSQKATLRHKEKVRCKNGYTLCWHHHCHTVKTSALWGKMLLSSRSLNSNEATKLPPIHIKICLMKFQTNHPSSNLTCTAHYNHADYFWAEKSLLFCLGFLHSCGPVSQQGHSIFALMQSPTALKGEKHSSYYLKVPLF